MTVRCNDSVRCEDDRLQVRRCGGWGEGGR